MSLFVILIGLMFFFLAFGTPIFSALGLSTILTMDYAGDASAFLSIIQKMFSSDKLCQGCFRKFLPHFLVIDNPPSLC